MKYTVDTSHGAPGGRHPVITIEVEGDEPIEYRLIAFCAETLKIAAGHACVVQGPDPVVMSPSWPLQPFGRRA